MEFRQVVSVCRSAAAATRPCLTSTRPSPSSILLQQRHFTTNNKQQSEAAAAVAEQQTPTSRYERIAQLQHSLSQNRTTPTPPRPPFRQNNMLDISKRPPPVWAIPHNPTNTAGGRSPLIRSTMLTGRAPTNSSSGPGGGLYNLPNQITSDMEQSLGTTPNTSTSPGMMSTWNEEAFLRKNYDVSEPELRLRPSTGRTVDIKGSVDLARGFRLLQRAVSQNRVKTDVRLAKFYERPALKRKRQKRERWQVRFKEGFKAAIWRAMELKGQGW
jgi:small subunit ribosomal protein MRP21